MDSKRLPHILVAVFIVAMVSPAFPATTLAWQTETITDHSSAEEIYALAASYYSDQKWDLAIEQFQLLKKTHSQDELAANATFYLGESLVQSNQHPLAEKVFSTFLQEQPENLYATRAQFRLAECKYLQNQFEPARAMFLKFMADHGSDPLAEFSLPYLGELHLRFGEPAKGKQAYEQALRRFPSSGLSNKCRLGLAQSLSRLGSTAEAERFYRFVAEQTNDALADDATMLIGKMYAERGQWDQAKKEFDQLVRKFPESELITETKYLNAKRDLIEGNWESSWTAIEPLMDQPMNDNLFTRIALDAAVVAVRVDKLDRAQEFIDRVRHGDRDKAALEFASVVEIDIANRKNDVRKLQTLVTAFEHNFKDSIHMTRCIEPLARKHYDRSEFAEAAVRYQQLIELASMKPELARNLSAWRYLLGLSRIGTGQYQLALSHLQSIRDFGSNQQFEAATSFAIATALTGEKRWAESIPHYRTYLSLLPEGQDAVRCHADLTVAQVNCDQLDQAVQTIDAVAEKHSQELAVLGACEIVAEAALKNNNKETARRFFQMLAKSNHRDFASRGANGLVWAGDDEMMSAENLKKLIDGGVDKNLALEAVIGKVQELQAANQHQQTVDILKNIIGEHSDSPYVDEARFRLALSMQRIGGKENSKQAAELLTAFTTSQPHHELAELGRYELAWAKHDSGDVAGAEQQFTEIVDNHPKSKYRIDACYRAAMLSRQTGNDSKARLRLRQLIAWAPNNSLAAYAHYTLGEFESQQKNWDEAITLFKSVIDTSADQSLINPARYWLAESLYQSSQIDAAEKEFFELKDTQFDNTEINSVVKLRLAQCAAKRTDWAQVASVIHEIRADETDTTPGFQLDYLQGRVFMSQAKFVEAREMFSRVLTVEQAAGTQTAAMSQWMIGESWFHQEQYKDALRAYLLVDSLYDFAQWRSLALLQAAKCHLKLGDSETATKTCNRMLNTFPDSSHANDARELLAEINATSGPLKPKTLPANFSK